jgi:hypothetical protein
VLSQSTLAVRTHRAIQEPRSGLRVLVAYKSQFSRHPNETLLDADGAPGLSVGRLRATSLLRWLRTLPETQVQRLKILEWHRWSITTDHVPFSVCCQGTILISRTSGRLGAKQRGCDHQDESSWIPSCKRSRIRTELSLCNRAGNLNDTNFWLQPNVAVHQYIYNFNHCQTASYNSLVALIMSIISNRVKARI